MADTRTGAAAPIPAAVRAAIPATVIRLPSADGQAIQQHPPRGRRPKHVLSMWRARFDRSQAVAVFALDAQIELAVEVRHACYLRGLALSKERREIERRDEAIRIEYKVLADLVRALEARRALAAKGGAA